MSQDIEPRVTIGDYDEHGCWHPRWMNETGQWEEGWGWYDEGGAWQVERGHFDAQEVWVPAAAAALVVAPPEFAPGVDEEPLPAIGRFDSQPLPFIGSSAAAHAAFLLFAMMMPDNVGALDLDNYNAQDRFVQAALTNMQEDKPPVVAGWANDSAPDAETAKHAGEEGQAGDPAEAATGKRIAIKGPADNEDLVIAKARNREIAMSAGVASQVSSLWATADNSVGVDAIHALGNLDGSDPGASGGIFGMGVRGNGRGGGGNDGDSLGRHNVDTKGLSGVDRGCKGVKCGSGSGTGVNGWDKDTQVPAQVVPGKPTLVGNLDREIIQRVVRNHRRELKYCYEQQLQKDKTLGGELMVKFTIAADGSVLAALTEQSSSSLKNASVASCVTNKIRRWVFPRSPGNEGMVVVRYPFRFSKG